MCVSNDTVYHYCSSNSFLSIISNRTIRMSDILKSNDSMEIRWIVPLIKKGFEDYYKKTNPRFKSFYPYETLNQYVNQFIDAYFLRGVQGEGKIFTMYVSCFSYIGDLLGQWRGYADDGKGYSIGFDKSILEDFHAKDFKLVTPHCSDVLYNKKKQFSIVTNELITLFSRLKNNAESLQCDRDTTLKTFKESFNRLQVKAVFMKNPFFMEEQEWRMGIINFENDGNPKKVQILRNTVLECIPVKYRSTEEGLVSFIDMPFDASIVKNIVIGPKNNSSISDVRDYLVGQGFTANVSKSIGTYR